MPDSADDIDRAIVAQAARAVGVTPAETVTLLEANGARLIETLSALRDEDLDCSTPSVRPAGSRSRRLRSPTSWLGTHASTWHMRAPLSPKRRDQRPL